jgi:hypothetical protein
MVAAMAAPIAAAITAMAAIMAVLGHGKGGDESEE